MFAYVNVGYGSRIEYLVWYGLVLHFQEGAIFASHSNLDSSIRRGRGPLSLNASLIVTALKRQTNLDSIFGQFNLPLSHM